VATFVKAIPLIGSLSVQQYVLENGLQIAVVEDPTAPIFTYQTWFRVGSADEKPGHQGLAHLFEHMMFRKTKKREMGEWERQVNINGGTGINAYTSRDQTVYFFTFPNDKLDLAAELEADRMTNLMIEQKMFETEKGAVLTERNRGLDSPERYLWEELYKLTYVRHTYRYSIIGEEDSIKSFSVEEAQNFYQTYYAPNNALIIVVGDVKTIEVVNTIERHYSGFRSRSTNDVKRLSEPAQREDRKNSVTHKRAQQTMIAKTWHIPSFSHEDYVPLVMLGRILAVGKTSPLQERLVNQAKTTSAYADAFIGKDVGTFEFYAQLADTTSFDEVEKIVVEEIEKCSLGQISDDQLSISKNTLLKDYYQSIASPSSLARLLGESFINVDDMSYSIRLLPQFESIIKEAIARVARQYILNAKSTTMYLSPEKQPC
jgi:zinc protease